MTESAFTKKEAVEKLKTRVVSRMINVDPDLTIEEAFEQYIMYRNLGV